MARFSQRSRTALLGVHPDLVRVMEAAIQDTPVDFVITEGVRTEARQKQLYAQGRTIAGPKVTNKDGVRNKSNHQTKADGFGHAIDLYPFVEGAAQVHDKRVDGWLHMIAAHIKATAARLGVGITWGGDWRNPYDPPHFELKK